jgi:hypothetical protein
MHLVADLRKFLEWLSRDSPPALTPIDFAGTLIVGQDEHKVRGQMVSSPLGYVGVLYFERDPPPAELNLSYDLTLNDGTSYLVKLEHITENGGYAFQTSLPGGIDAAVTYGIG